MSCEDEVKSFFDKAVDAIANFIDDLGSAVGAVLEEAWKKVGAPIVEFVFGLLGFTDETVYSIQVVTQPLITDIPNDNMSLAVLRALQLNINIADSLQNLLVTGIVGTNTNYKEFGKNYYTHGLPTTNTVGRSVDEAAVEAVILVDEGLVNITLISTFLGYPLDEYWVKYWLQNNEAYKEIPGEITIPGVGALDGLWFYDGYTEDIILGTFTVHLRRPDLAPTEFRDLPTIIPAPPFDLFYNVKYIDDDATVTSNLYWMYQRSLGTHPTLDGGIASATHQIDEMLPIVPLRRNFLSVNNNFPVASWTGLQGVSDPRLYMGGTYDNFILDPSNKYTLHTFTVTQLSGSGAQIGRGYFLNARSDPRRFEYDEASNSSSRKNNGFLLAPLNLPTGDFIGTSIAWMKNGFEVIVAVFVSAPTNETVMVRYILSTAYDLSVITGVTRILSSQVINPFTTRVLFNSEGTIFYNYTDNGVIYETTLTSPWDLFSGTSVITIVMSDVIEVFIQFNKNGTKAYVSMNSTTTAFARGVKTYNLTTPYKLSTGGLDVGVAGDTNAIDKHSYVNNLVKTEGFYFSEETRLLCRTIKDTGDNLYYTYTDFMLPLTDPAYFTSKRVLDIVGLDIDLLIIEIEKNAQIALIEDAFILFAINIYSQTQEALKVLFINFDVLFFDAQVDEADFLANESTTDPKFNTVTIVEQSYNTAIVFNYIRRTDVVGVIGTVGTYNSTLTILPNSDYDPTLFFGGGINSYITYRFQYNATNHIELKVHGLFMITNILTTANTIKTQLTELNDIDAAIRANFIIPFPYLILSDLEYREKEKVIYESLHMVLYASDVTYLAYYETPAFLNFISAVIKIGAIVILITSLGNAISFSSALWILAEQLLIQYALNILLNKLLLEVQDNDTQKALVYAAYIGASLFFNDINNGGLTTAEILLLGVQAALNVISADISIQADLLQGEIDAFSKEAEERQKELDDALDGLNSDLAPWEITSIFLANPSETPDQFYNRTVHTGNPGVLVLDQISNYHANALKLPEIGPQDFMPSSLYE